MLGVSLRWNSNPFSTTETRIRSRLMPGHRARPQTYFKLGYNAILILTRRCKAKQVKSHKRKLHVRGHNRNLNWLFVTLKMHIMWSMSHYSSIFWPFFHISIERSNIYTCETKIIQCHTFCTGKSISFVPCNFLLQKGTCFCNGYFKTWLLELKICLPFFSFLVISTWTQMADSESTSFKEDVTHGKLTEERRHSVIEN